MEFLFDNTWIDRTGGVRRVAGVAKKHPEPLLVQQTPWEADSLHPKCAIFRDPERGRWRMYYGTRAGETQTAPDAAGTETTEREAGQSRGFVCYAESEDGIRWERPVLDRVAFRGSRANNILAETGGDSVFWNVVHDPEDENPDRRYKALGFGHGFSRSRIPNTTNGLGVAFSPDGLDWRNATLVADTSDLTDADCLLPERDPATGLWTAFLRPRTRPKRRFIGYATSGDFLHWTAPRMLLTPDAEDSAWTEFYGLAAIPVAGWRVGCLWIFHNHPDAGEMTNELVSSRHGTEYSRVLPRSQFLPLGANGAPDSRGLWPVRLIDCGDEIRIYCIARNHTHGSDRLPDGTAGEMSASRPAPGESPRGSLVLARLPWGHFCGLQASLTGEIETKWLTMYGEAGLSVVAEMETNGAVTAELLDVYGNPVPGYGREESRLLPSGERETVRRVVWGDDRREARSGAPGLEGHVVKIRFHLHRATLYGFALGDETARLS